MNYETLKMELTMNAMDEFTAGTNSTSLETSEGTSAGTSEGTSEASSTSTIEIETETIVD